MLCLFLTGLYGQSGETQEQTVYRRYATQAYQQLLYKQDPALRQKHQEQEKQLAAQKERVIARPYSIPVVFHLLTGPDARPIEREAVLQQIATLNRDFAHEMVIRHKADTLEGFAARARKMDLTFCFPHFDPQGRKLDGPAIFYHTTDTAAWTTGQAMKTERRQGVTPWDTERYLNIWVVELKNNVAGYAQMPGGPAATDGIVIDRDFFGAQPTPSPYGQGRTLTHLVGSYLGLHELWNEYDYCADDGVDDTPIHNAPNTRSFAYKHISLCSGYPVEMTMNFMDATQDRFQYMFTHGQKQRMHTILQLARGRKGLRTQPVQCTSQLRSLSDELSISKPFYISTFPNPATDRIQITLSGETQGPRVEMLIYGSTGQLFYQQTWHQSSSFFRQQLDLATQEWPPGVYVAYVYSEEKSYTARFILID